MITTKSDGTKLYYGLPWDKYFALDEPARKKHIKQHFHEQEQDRLKRSKAYAAKVDAERKQAEREVEEQRRQAERQRVESSLRHAFLTAGGTEAEFEKAKERLIREAIEAEASAQIEQTTASVNRALRSNF